MGHEIERLEKDKLNRGGDTITGDLSVRGALRLSTGDAEGTNDFDVKKSTTWDDVPDLSVTFSIAQPTNVLVFYQINMQAGSVGIFSTRLWVDTGEWKTTSRAGAGATGVAIYCSPSNLQM